MLRARALSGGALLALVLAGCASRQKPPPPPIDSKSELRRIQAELDSEVTARRSAVNNLNAIQAHREPAPADALTPFVPPAIPPERPDDDDETRQLRASVLHEERNITELDKVLAPLRALLTAADGGEK